MASVRQLPSGRWELRVYVGRDPLTGKPKYKSRVEDAQGKKDAQRKANRLEDDLRDGSLSGDGGTFGKLCRDWIEHKTRRWSPSTLKEHRRIVKCYLSGPIAKTEVAKIRTRTIDELYAQLQARGGRCQHRPCPRRPCPRHGSRCERKGCTRPTCEPHDGACAGWTPCGDQPCDHGAPLAVATVNRIDVVVHAALEQAVIWGWLRHNPADRADPGEILDEEAESPDDIDIVRLLATAEQLDPRLAVYLFVAVETGARRGAMHAVRRTYLDLTPGRAAARFPKVIVIGNEGLVERPATRTKKSGKRVALSTYCATALRGHLAAQDELAKAAGTHLVEDAFVFTDDPAGARPWRPDSTTRKFRQVRGGAELDDVLLRHARDYMATRLLDAGVSPKIVAQRGGWTKVATMLDRYAHALPVSDRQAAETIGKIIGHGKQP